MSRAPLAGLRVLASSQFGAGPFGTQLLADLGAEVIKIEDPGVGGDVSRYTGPDAADGDSLFFQSFNDKPKFWDALLEALELPEVGADPRFATFADRLANKTALIALLKSRFQQRTTAEWLARMRGRVPCAPVNTLAEALVDEQVLARDMIIEVEHPELGTIREVASPIKTPGAVTSPAPAPRLGQHTDAILTSLLGYAPERIAALRAGGAFGTPVG